MPHKNPHYYRDYFRAQGESRRAYLRDRYQADPSKQAAAKQRYREAHPDRVRAQNNSPAAKARMKRWRYADLERNNRNNLRRTLAKLGIALSWYEQTLEAQHGCCAVCGSPPPQKARLHIDHCHISGKVRALLCLQCNAALGIVRDDPSRLFALAHYLLHHTDLKEVG